MIDEKILVEQLNELKDKCWDRAKKENNINFARKQLDISQVIGIINIQPKIGGWIPCSERLPEDGVDVLVWYEYFRYGEYNRLFQTTGISFAHNGKWSGFVNGQSGWNQLRIIAWQPTPEDYHE